MVFIYFSPIFSLSFLICTSIVLSPTITRVPHTLFIISSLVKTFSGLDPNKYGGHSLRSGFATSAAEFGAEERNIMAMTGHKTTQMVRRYIQEANLFKNNALNKIKL